jgi:methionine-S-sulfoxide reductase
MDMSRIFVRGFALAWLLLMCACSRSERPGAEAATSQPARASAAPSDPSAPLAKTETAIFSGGCFWGVEELVRQLPGVIDTEVGYTGGSVEHPDYSDVHTGRSGHAEAVRVVFDPRKLSYERLLLYFFSIHDPTTKNRQGNDIGSQYRSAIFVSGGEQRAVAERVIERVQKSGDWKAPTTTEVVPAGVWNSAESYHQDYLQKNPGGYTCHFQRDTSFY